MGWKKSFKKAVKKVGHAVSNVVKEADRVASGTVNKVADTVVKATGTDGTFVGDTIKAAARSTNIPTRLGATAAGVVGGESAKNASKALMLDVSRSTPTGESQYRKVAAAARQSAEYAALQRKADEEYALAQAMAKKKAQVATQESEKARPITDSYLSSGGSLGGYVDAEELKKKKKLGGGGK